MRKIKYLLLFLFIFCFAFPQSLSAQGQGLKVFNDTILFSIVQMQIKPNGDRRFLLDFQSVSGATQSFSGTIVMNLCACYCDSIWDAWPTEINNPVPGGQATISYMSKGKAGGPSGPLGTGNPGNPQRGRLNIWKAPAGINRTSAFTLPVVFKFD